MRYTTKCGKYKYVYIRSLCATQRYVVNINIFTIEIDSSNSHQTHVAAIFIIYSKGITIECSRLFLIYHTKSYYFPYTVITKSYYLMYTVHNAVSVHRS